MTEKKSEEAAMPIDDWGAPVWQMTDAYGTGPDDQKYVAARARLTEKLEAVHAIAKLAHTATAIADQERHLMHLVRLLDTTLPLLWSLRAFMKCLNAKESSNSLFQVEDGNLAILAGDLDPIVDRVWTWVAEKYAEIPAAERPDEIVHWWPLIEAHRTMWTRSLSPEAATSWQQMGHPVLLSMMRLQKELQKGLRGTVAQDNGEPMALTPSSMVAILKGHPDATLRQNTAKAAEAYYEQTGDAYAVALNTIHTTRRTFLSPLGKTELDVSLAANRMGKTSLTAMLTAIDRARPWLRKAVSLRTRALGLIRSDQVGQVGQGESSAESPMPSMPPMPYWDLLAPAPAALTQGEVTVFPTKGIPYAEGIGMVKAALSRVSPEMSDFVQLMLDRGWVDARPSAQKIGGAFYTRFDALQMPRVFSSYVGTMTSVLQQAHELGHAFHYWVMRELPPALTQFPMTLTEMASTFNEALVREYLFAEASDAERFSMLWQELRSAANFLFHTPTRMRFELAFIEKQERLGTSALGRGSCVTLMKEAWMHYYGGTATPDPYLWAHKAHFYKADDVLYNYPYTVGYLLSLALLNARDRMGAEKFYRDCYVPVLRLSGRMSVEETLDWVMGHAPGTGVANDTACWTQILDRVKGQVDRFEALLEAREAAAAAPSTVTTI